MSAADREASVWRDGYINRWFIDPLVGRGYPQDMVDAYGSGMEFVQPGDLDTIAVPVDFLGMMWSITQMVIIPVFAGLLFNHYLSSRFPWVERLLPLLSMAGIALIISIITAAGRDDLLTIGLALIGATLLHNLAGYFLGYWGGRLFRMPESDCRTVALEVGMQNGGLASALAMDMVQKNLASVSVALAPAVFGPMMNITGSSLATWWRARPPQEDVGQEGDLRRAP